jgi:hypothetical protein
VQHELHAARSKKRSSTSVSWVGTTPSVARPDAT